MPKNDTELLRESVKDFSSSIKDILRIQEISENVKSSSDNMASVNVSIANNMQQFAGIVDNVKKSADSISGNADEFSRGISRLSSSVCNKIDDSFQTNQKAHDAQKDLLSRGTKVILYKIGENSSEMSANFSAVGQKLSDYSANVSEEITGIQQKISVSNANLEENIVKVGKDVDMLSSKLTEVLSKVGELKEENRKLKGIMRFTLFLSLISAGTAVYWLLKIFELLPLIHF